MKVLINIRVFFSHEWDLRSVLFKPVHPEHNKKNTQTSKNYYQQDRYHGTSIKLVEPIEGTTETDMSLKIFSPQIK